MIPKNPNNFTFQDASLGFKFRLIHEQFKRKRNQQLEKMGITSSQLPVMLYLIMHEGEKINVKCLCDAVHVTHPTMVGLLSRMEEKGLVEQQIDAGNRRSRLVVLTEAGRKLMQVHKIRWVRNEKELIAGMKQEDVDELNRLLEIIYCNLKEDEDDG